MPRSATTIDRDWVRHSLSGPITGVHPPFHRDGSLDYDGLRTEIEHNISAGTGVLLLTYGAAFTASSRTRRSRTSLWPSWSRPVGASWLLRRTASGGRARK